MAPGLFVNPATSLLAGAGVGVAADPLAADLLLRAVGGAVFAAVVLRNRQRGEAGRPDADAVPETA
jgi:hypothetical protein